MSAPRCTASGRSASCVSADPGGCRQVGWGMLMVGLLILIAAVATRLADHEELHIPLFVAFFPFWIPGGVLASQLIFAAAQRFTRCDPLHPRFAKAFESRGSMSGEA